MKKGGFSYLQGAKQDWWECLVKRASSTPKNVLLKVYFGQYEYIW